MTDEGAEMILPEDRISREPKERTHLAIIGTSDDNESHVVGIGYEITDPNDSLDIKQLLFAEDRSENPEPANVIFIETNDDIYRLVKDENGDAHLQSAKESSKRESYGTFKGPTLRDPHLSDKILAQVGKPFNFGSFETGRVMKITAVNKDSSNPITAERTEQLRKGPTSDIEQRFLVNASPK